MARCVILSACPVSPALAGLLREDDFIIACDAGYRNCAPLHCKPHVIVGDFDTAPCPQQEDDEIVVLPHVKDDTDTEYAAKLAVQIEHEGWWMGTVPLLIQADSKPHSTSMFGFSGHPMFRCEDLGNMIARDFGSHRGQLARGLYFMLENTAILLRQSNLILKLDSFEWDWAKAQIFTPAYAPPETTAPTVPQKENVG